MNTPTNNDNVVNLHGDRSSQVRSEILMKESLARLPRSIQRVREVAQTDFKAAIHNLFDHVDDSLFELADRAVSNLEQNVFFESMREIRIQRRAMEKRFLFHIDSQFAVLVGDKQDEFSIGLQRSAELDEDTDDLSLVSKEELEELVAIDSFVGKSQAQNKTMLMRLAAGINSVLKTKLNEETFPIAPRALADSFVDSTTLINIDIKAKLVLFKLFERYVIAELSGVLNKINAALSEEGVSLPSKSPIKRRSVQAPLSPQVGTHNQPHSFAEGHHQNPESTGLYETLQSLLQNQQQPQGPSNFSNVGYAPQGSEGYGVTEVSYALMTALSQLQQQVQAMPVSAQAQPTLLSGGHIQSALQSVTQDEQVDDRSQDVIKLVDMLFSFILEDENLPDPVKLLLSRLQIPFIKVALSDEEFFKKEGHPARRLLNEMAMASIGLSGDTVHGKRDILLNKIEAIVNKVLLEFDNNFEIFTLLLTDFIAFMEKERRRVMLFEKRALDAEDGKAKAEVGRSHVDNNFDRLLKGRDIPDAYSSFIKGPWSNILFLIYMRQGIESKQWAQALRVAKELVWSALDIRSEEHKAKLGVLMPRLQTALKNGLDNISFNPVKQAKYLEQFEEHYQNLLISYNQAKMIAASDRLASKSQEIKQTIEAAPTTNMSEQENKAVNESAKVYGNENKEAKPVSVNLKHADESASTLNAPIPAAAETSQIMTKAASNEESNEAIFSEDSIEAALKEIDSILESPKPKASEAKPVVSSLDVKDVSENTTATVSPNKINPEEVQAVAPQYLNLVDNFTVGVWFEKKDKDEVSYRCRLAAIIRATGKYIFVNRSGVKVAEETRESLGKQLESGSLRTLDDGMLFDRALESLIKNLRQPQ